MSNNFDRILRENSEEIFKTLIQKELGVIIVKWRKLPEKFTSTVQREIDFLSEVTTQNLDKFLLHIEFQSTFDKNMIYRMAEYHSFIVKKYKKTVEHVVIYLGSRRAQMVSELSHSLVFKGFSLVSLYDLDGEELLSSQVPEQIILALLANNKESQPELLLINIFEHLKEICNSPAELNKYITQLNILARLRKFDDDLLKFIDDMPITLPYKVEEDAFYKRGMEKGLEKGLAKKEKVIAEARKEILLNMIKLGKSIEGISELTGLSIDEIKAIIP